MQALVDQYSVLARASGAPTLSLMRRAVSLSPSRYEAAHNLGAALMSAGLYHESLEAFTRSLDLAPGPYRATAHHHIGMAWHDIGDFDKAVESYNRAIEADPDDVEIRQSRAIAKLASGDLSGLYEFEVRYHKAARKPIAACGIPRWQGEDLADKTIIVAHEQGFGDTLQFCRFIPQLKAARVILSGPPMLTGLIADNFSFDAVISEDGPFEADYYCSPMSACAALGIRYHDVNGKPYVNADRMNLPDRGKLKAGLVWRGSSGYAQDANRSMTLDALGPLFEIPGLALYSLQVGEFAKDITKAGLDGFIANLTPLIKDWRDTARAIAALDVVVAVDTAVAHLAGAMGKRVMILLPYSCCWRWMRDTDKSPWYESAKLFRQMNPRDWSYPVAGVAKELGEMI